MKKSLIGFIVGLMFIAPVLFAGGEQEPSGAESPVVKASPGQKYSESPILTEMVQKGELPPVDERLPIEPLVIEPYESIGKYGGSMTVATLTPTGGVDSAHTRIQHLFKRGMDLASYEPNIAKGWEFSDDLMTFTVYLREGMKWSDGEPFTSADILFWYEDILLNEELTPTIPGVWRPGGKVVEVSAPDEYTAVFKYSQPRPQVVEQMQKGQGGDPFAAKHHLTQYHIKYNEKAAAIAKDEGYESWFQGFKFHNTAGMSQQDLDLPTINPWVLAEITPEGNKYYGRNPYYHAVDTAGNQLPYIDEQIQIVVANSEVLELKAISGEFDIVGSEDGLQLKNHSLYKANEEKGGYRTLLWDDPSVACSYNFNMTHKDPVLKEIFNDLRFRQAMSLAINREEISKVLYFGMAVPHQGIVEPGCSFYEDWMGPYFTEYDPERAEDLLDDMGLQWDSDKKYRLRPDGDVLMVSLEYSPRGEFGEIGQLTREYWEAVGLKVVLKEDTQALWVQRGRSNDRDVGGWHVVGRSYLLFSPPWNLPALSSAGVPWFHWHNSNGEQGEEPPELIREIFELVDEWVMTVPESPEYVRIGKVLLGKNVENLLSIGTVGLVPSPVLIRSNIRNIPEEAVWSPYFRHWDPYKAETWFFE